MKAGSDGRPSPELLETFVDGAATPVDLQMGPDGMLYYVSIGNGQIRRIRFVDETTPPTVVATSPASGAGGVAVDANVVATFSEPMDPATVNASTVVLRSGGVSGPVVSAGVSYDAATKGAVLDPAAALAAGTTFSVVVKGGAGGVKDVAGNPLAADESWSFTTTATPAGSVQFLSDLPFVVTPVNGWGPIERDRSNGEQGAADGVTLRVGAETFAKGLGVHAGSEARFAVPAGCTRLQARVGLDEEVGARGTVGFKVFAGATQLGSTVARDGTQPSVLVDVDVTGHTEIRLVVDGGSDGIDWDHADWGDAKYFC